MDRVLKRNWRRKRGLINPLYEKNAVRAMMIIFVMAVGWFIYLTGISVFPANFEQEFTRCQTRQWAHIRRNWLTYERRDCIIVSDVTGLPLFFIDGSGRQIDKKDKS
jgi:hypothetical protein